MRPLQDCHPEQSPRHNAHQRDVSIQAVCGLQATLFDRATVLKNFMKDLDLPATTVPTYFFECLLEAGDGQVGQEHPFNGMFAVKRLNLRHKDPMERDGGQWLE
jgi:hypothetical protein